MRAIASVRCETNARTHITDEAMARVGGEDAVHKTYLRISKYMLQRILARDKNLYLRYFRSPVLILHILQVSS